MSVIVPTVEVEPPPSRFWSTMIAMLSSRSRRPQVVDSAAGSCGRRTKLSYSWRCASVAIVSNTTDDLPEPDTPVKIVICAGMRSEMS